MLHPLTAQVCQLTAGLTSTCLQPDVKEHSGSLMVACPPPPVASFLEQDYHSKSVATQISHDAGLALIPNIG